MEAQNWSEESEAWREQEGVVNRAGRGRAEHAVVKACRSCVQVDAESAATAQLQGVASEAIPPLYHRFTLAAVTC
jgi:hypothetical protein